MSTAATTRPSPEIARAAVRRFRVFLIQACQLGTWGPGPGLPSSRAVIGALAALAGSPTGPSAIRPRRCRHILVFGRVVLRRRPRPVIRVGPCAALTAVAAAILALRRRGSAALRAVRGAAGPCGTGLRNIFSPAFLTFHDKRHISPDSISFYPQDISKFRPTFLGYVVKHAAAFRVRLSVLG